jgi:hypothetical protein
MDMKSAKMSALAELIKKLFKMESKEHAGTLEGDALLAIGKKGDMGGDMSEEYLEPDMEKAAEVKNPALEAEEDYRSMMRKGGKMKPHGRASKGIAMAIEVHKPKMAKGYRA